MATTTRRLVLGGQRKLVERDFRTMTQEEVRALRPGERIWFIANDGLARQVKVNGAVKTWKRNPDRLEIPVKYGLYQCARFSLEESQARLLKPVEGEGKG